MTQRTFVIAAGCALVGLFAGMSGAQGIQASLRTGYLNTGLFTVAENHEVAFHVALDDDARGAPARVLLQILDETGVIVASQDTRLATGQAITLRLAQAGTFRGHAEVVQRVGLLSGRRAVVGTVEVIDSFGTAIRPVCSIDHTGVGAGRD